MDRIRSHGRDTPNLRVGPAENSFGRHIAVCFPREYQNAIRAACNSRVLS